MRLYNDINKFASLEDILSQENGFSMYTFNSNVDNSIYVLNENIGDELKKAKKVVFNFFINPNLTLQSINNLIDKVKTLINDSCEYTCNTIIDKNNTTNDLKFKIFTA